MVANHRDAPLAGGMDRARIEDFLRHPVAAEIPHDAVAIGASVSLGVPVVIGGTPRLRPPPSNASQQRSPATPVPNPCRAAGKETQPAPARLRSD